MFCEEFFKLSSAPIENIDQPILSLGKTRKCPQHFKPEYVRVSGLVRNVKEYDLNIDSVIDG